MRRQATSRFLSALALALLLVMAAGCGTPIEEGEVVATDPTEAVAAVDDNALVAEYGEVVAGEVLTHRFAILNRTAEVQFVNSSSDIVVRCGCSSVVLDTEKMPPGGTMRATVRIDTAGRSGGLAHGGSVTLTSARGETRLVTLTLRGTINPALTLTPSSLSFSPEQISAGVEQVVVVRAAVPVDWKTFSLTSSSECTRVMKISSDGQVGTFAAKYEMPADAETSEDVVTAQVVASAKDGVLAGKTLTAPLPVVARGPPRLVVRPSIVPITFRGESKEGTSRLVVLARKASDPVAVESITCEAFEVKWLLDSRAGDRTHLLKLTFASTDGPAATEDGIVRIKLKGEDVVRLPTKKIFIRGKGE